MRLRRTTAIIGATNVPNLRILPILRVLLCAPINAAKRCARPSPTRHATACTTQLPQFAGVTSARLPPSPWAGRPRPPPTGRGSANSLPLSAPADRCVRPREARGFLTAIRWILSVASRQDLYSPYSPHFHIAASHSRNISPAGGESSSGWPLRSTSGPSATSSADYIVTAGCLAIYPSRRIAASALARGLHNAGHELDPQ